MEETRLHEPKQDRSRHTLRQITQAALELIAEQGVGATTISAIVQRSGSSVGSFYARFKSKADLLVYLDESIWEEARKRWIKATRDGWGDRGISEVVRGLGTLYAELELTHRAARDALAQALRGPGAGPSATASHFRAKVRQDSRRLLLDCAEAIRNPSSDRAVETTCRSLEACAPSLDPASMADLSTALVRHLLGEPPPAPSAAADVEFFDIWG